MAIFVLRVSREFNQKFLSGFVSIQHFNSSDFVGKHLSSSILTLHTSRCLR